MQKLDLLCNYPQGTNNILARSMSFLIQGKDERWMKSHFNIIVDLHSSLSR